MVSDRILEERPAYLLNEHGLLVLFEVRPIQLVSPSLAAWCLYLLWPNYGRLLGDFRAIFPDDCQGTQWWRRDLYVTARPLIAHASLEEARELAQYQPVQQISFLLPVACNHYLHISSEGEERKLVLGGVTGAAMMTSTAMVMS